MGGSTRNPCRDEHIVFGRPRIRINRCSPVEVPSCRTRGLVVRESAGNTIRGGAILWIDVVVAVARRWLASWRSVHGKDTKQKEKRRVRLYRPGEFFPENKLRVRMNTPNGVLERRTRAVRYCRFVRFSGRPSFANRVCRRIGERPVAIKQRARAMCRGKRSSFSDRVVSLINRLINKRPSRYTWRVAR